MAAWLAANSGVVDVSTQENRQIVGGYALQPNWFPNGRRIVYWGSLFDPITGMGDRDDSPTDENDIWTIPADGGDPVAVTNDAAYDWNPVWSGDYVYYSSDRSGSMNLWRVPIDEETGFDRHSGAGVHWNRIPDRCVNTWSTPHWTTRKPHRGNWPGRSPKPYTSFFVLHT